MSVAEFCTTIYHELFMSASVIFQFLYMLQRCILINVSVVSINSSGQSTVEFECVKETDLILIHSNKLNYTTLDNTHIVRLSAPGTVHNWGYKCNNIFLMLAFSTFNGSEKKIVNSTNSTSYLSPLLFVSSQY